MHIKRCTASIDQDYLSRYKELQKTKSAKKGLLNNYSQKISLPYHAYRIRHQKLFSRIFSATPGLCTNQILLKHMIYHPSAKVVANHLRAIQKLLKKVQFFSWETKTYRG